MKVTEDRLAVARAVQDEMRGARMRFRRPAELEDIIAAIPEPPDDSPATLPAPTGPGFYWVTSRITRREQPVEVFASDNGNLVVNVCGDDGYGVDEFHSWLPLVAPTAKGGAE